MRVPLLGPDGAVPAPLPAVDWHASEAPLSLATYTAAALTSPMTGPQVSATVHLGEAMQPMTGSSSSTSNSMPGMDMGGTAQPSGGMPGMDGPMSMQFTVDGKTFPDTPTVEVNRADVVTLTFVNDGMLEHPMHVHGHAFTVLSTNGVPWRAGVLKDTVTVPPHGTVVVRFVADNPGVWMVHGHELHHAAAGMDFLLAYRGAPRLAQLGGSSGAVPE